MASISLLETVALHEKSLMDDLEGARDEARHALDAAHAQSASLLQDTNEKLETEIAALRREAARARDEERAAIQKATALKIEQIRSESAGRTPEVRNELIARVLPGA